MDLKKMCEEVGNEIRNTNFELQQFYEQELPVLFKHPLDKIPLALLREMAEQLHYTLLDYGKGEWQAIVQKMGLEDNRQIRNVTLYAKAAGELPITFALQGPLSHNRSYGDIIKCLLEENRFDVLRDLKPFTEKLINEGQNSSFSGKTLFYKLYSDLQPPADFTKDPPKESLKEEMMLEKNSIVAPKSEKALEKTSLVVKLPKEPEYISSITAFIPHTTQDQRTAEVVLTELRKGGILGKLLSELDHLFAINRSRALNAVLCEVDFIIPIISEAYIRQVCPSVCGVQDEETANNCFIFNQFCSEVLWTGCLNYRVRPILVPDFNRELLNPYAFLRDCALGIPEIPKLTRILKCTKSLIRNVRS
ncbi:uncharacterized protein LOC129220130 [Uloborus diversus]|uniref:uncharacterized protein LOC129220130 n=1 Tax=Uloborus diversus TaxID=327109 RepID=UPI00240A755D|nr:uncharacterized protein LOC129220130 [Uloborus diversus]